MTAECRGSILAILALLSPALIGTVSAEDLNSRMADHEANGELLQKFAFTEDMPTSKSFALYSSAIRGLEKYEPGGGAMELSTSLKIPMDEAVILADAMIAAHLAVAMSADSYVKQAMCAGNSPAVFGKSAFAVLQGTYQAVRQAESTELHKVLDGLSATTAQKLLDKLEKQKKSSAYFEVDYEKFYERTNRSVDAKIAEICIRTGEVR